MSNPSLTPVEFGASRLCIEDVLAIAGGHPVRLAAEPAFRRRVDAGSAFLDSLLAEHGEIYGVTTGYGDSCTVAIPPQLVADLPHHLYTYHGCGLGAMFDAYTGRAILAARLNSLAQGYSGVRWQLLEQLAALINADLVPVIPEEGSVGASGDLTPLSYVAAVLAGERDVYKAGAVYPAAKALAEHGIPPLRLAPKEGLALMNGTAVMTALACLAYRRADYLLRLSSRMTALASLACAGNSYHFDPKLFSVKPHPGQNRVAAWLHADLQAGEAPREGLRLQDRYSLRCAPHVLGVLADAQPMLRQFIENELNSANDNPIIDGEGEHVLHGGHFYGGHIAFAMDSLKNMVANIADLMDRQLALMVDTRYNHGLPSNLSGAQGERAAINHGFKAVQIGASSWAAEALKLTMPASVFSRSTECHNQDKVSMGTIAARDALRVLQLTEQVVAAHALAAVQGVELRIRQGELTREALSEGVLALLDEVRTQSAFLHEDRALDGELRAVLAMMRAEHFSVPEQSA
ncbi:HAL/PAL/TAL family ammonia-lyase [Chitinilyticum piscinae]|uniref:tyrosine ammonia-lyase n=1 Tax=Chitinilyticum piscinae TaxID=2866724 RepID=A0A8J7FV08_9NEIS|nr:aromatic amino acid ammonia-lyase [Chitinilyticum piscinae]MBE9607820.1 aromatic amino acid lyase [Chitinilyticum piscinae]